MPRSIVMLEINEVPYRVVDYYVERHPDSALARLLGRTRQYETVTTDSCRLSPWITWPSFHRGVNNEQHDIMHLGQNLERADACFPPIWKLLVDGGVSTGVFGALHTWPLPANVDRYEFFVSDPFASTPESHPPSLTSFQEFNLTMSRQSTRNVSSGFDVGSLVRFLAAAPRLGVRPQTLMKIVGQVIDERVSTWKRTRRRTYQPVLAFDLYMKQLEKHRPQFSNFFTNHVASAMHRYWAASFPSDYRELELSEQWQHQYRGEIDFAMHWFGDFFERLTRFADRNPEYIVMAASSMGQAASLGSRVDTQLYLRNPALFMQAAGLSKTQWSRRPAMDPTVSVVVDSEQIARFMRFLDDLHIDGAPIKASAKDGGFFDLHFGQTNLDPDGGFLRLRGEPFPHTELGFEITVVEDEGGSTAYHVPEGILLTYDPTADASTSERTRIETTDIAPCLLDHFGIDVPSYMSPPRVLAI